MGKITVAKFNIGQAVCHRLNSFRGVVFDVDPEFNKNEEWYQSIPADARPPKDQPFYHILAENSETQFIAYVSEQGLVADLSDQPVRYPSIDAASDQDDDDDEAIWPYPKLH